jgi:hypothetical protein
MLEQLLRLPVGRVDPPVENGSSILHPKITQLLQVVPYIVSLRLGNVFERDASIVTKGASRINYSAKIRYVERKFADGRRPSVRRSGVPTKTIEIAKPNESDFAEKNSVWSQNPVSSPR